ncbi:MAG: CCA tRNA nucleotidyltransferase [Rhizobiales bacterium]|nr:CCA tRNA nucleotidyltransferase [Hyphomicrobiales bacterium]
MNKLPEKLNLKNSKWLVAPSLLQVFDAIEVKGGKVRVVGGAIRNALMGEGVGDIDLCTTLLPEETTQALEAANIKAIPTGLEFGTITAVVDKTAYEITTLREDVETDGRHAVVKFGKDWTKDALRRDLTINALYCDRDGNLFDPLDNMDDLKNREVRFIGEASERIEEDYLRILRFFRFFAWYGSGRPDASGLKACAKLKGGLDDISAERVWIELKKTLEAKDPSRALLWMRTTGVLNIVLPESEKWGIDLIPSLLTVEERCKFEIDPMLRLMAVMPPRDDVVDAFSTRLKLSGVETKRLMLWTKTPKVEQGTNQKTLEKFFYENDMQAVLDVLQLDIATLEGRGEASADALKIAVGFLQQAQKWQRPTLPIKGKDLLALGQEAGPSIGKAIRALEAKWVESGFKLSKEELLAGL